MSSSTLESIDFMLKQVKYFWRDKIREEMPGVASPSVGDRLLIQRYSKMGC